MNTEENPIDTMEGVVYIYLVGFELAQNLKPYYPDLNDDIKMCLCLGLWVFFQYNANDSKSISNTVSLSPKLPIIEVD